MRRNHSRNKTWKRLAVAAAIAASPFVGADPDLLSGPIQNAVDKGISVIIINSGTPEQAAEVGALMSVGQPEYDAGLAVGQRATGTIAWRHGLSIQPDYSWRLP